MVVGSFRMGQLLNSGIMDLFIKNIHYTLLFASFSSSCLLSYGCKMAAAAPGSYPYWTEDNYGRGRINKFSLLAVLFIKSSVSQKSHTTLPFMTSLSKFSSLDHPPTTEKPRSQVSGFPSPFMGRQKERKWFRIAFVGNHQCLPYSWHQRICFIKQNCPPLSLSILNHFKQCFRYCIYATIFNVIFHTFEVQKC